MAKTRSPPEKLATWFRHSPFKVQLRCQIWYSSSKCYFLIAQRSKRNTLSDKVPFSWVFRHTNFPTSETSCPADWDAHFTTKQWKTAIPEAGATYERSAGATSNPSKGQNGGNTSTLHHLYAVGSTTWPHFKACRVNNLATFVSLPSFLFFKNLLLSAGRMTFL